MSLLDDLRARFTPPAPRTDPAPYRCCAARLAGFCLGTMRPVPSHPTEGALFRCDACGREAT